MNARCVCATARFSSLRGSGINGLRRSARVPAEPPTRGRSKPSSSTLTRSSGNVVAEVVPTFSDTSSA
jgi:hypothetical protein